MEIAMTKTELIMIVALVNQWLLVAVTLRRGIKNATRNIEVDKHCSKKTRSRLELALASLFCVCLLISLFGLYQFASAPGAPGRAEIVFAMVCLSQVFMLIPMVMLLALSQVQERITGVCSHIIDILRLG